MRVNCNTPTEPAVETLEQAEFANVMEWVGKPYKKRVFQKAIDLLPIIEMELLAVIVALEQLKKDGMQVLVFF